MVCDPQSQLEQPVERGGPISLRARDFFSGVEHQHVVVIFAEADFTNRGHAHDRAAAGARELAEFAMHERVVAIGVFITLAESTGPMRTEAVKAGFYETLYGKYPKIQILTIEELFSGKHPKIPLVDSASFKKAVKESEGGEQDRLPF